MKRKRLKYTGVRSRGENSFEINYYLGGKRVVENIKASSNEEASVVRHERLAGVKAQPQSTKETPTVTFEQAFERYLSYVEKLLDENTKQRSRCIYNHFLSYLGAEHPEVVYVHQVTGQTAKKYLEYLLGKPDKTPSGINTDIDKLRAIFKKFIELELLKQNPFYAIQKISKRLAKSKEKHLPTDYEIQQILEYTANDPSYREISRFLIRVGRRIEETCLYEKSDVLMNAAGRPIKIKVRPEIVKTGEAGELLFDEELSAIVQSAMSKNPDVKYLFTNVDKRKVAQNTYRLYLKQFCKARGLNDITPHCFRYYVCNKLLNSGVNLKDAMAITGHLDFKSFMSYIKTTEKGTLNALSVTRLDKII